MHGGSLRIVAAPHADITPSLEMKELLEFERRRGLDRADTWVAFGTRISRKIEIVRDVLGMLSRQYSIWGYGAAGKATMWVNACQMSYLGGMVDASPLRAGKFMPGTHTPIVFPDEFKRAQPQYVFITAWNYADVITANESWYRGTWAVPLPELKFF